MAEQLLDVVAIKGDVGGPDGDHKYDQFDDSKYRILHGDHQKTCHIFRSQAEGNEGQ